MLKAMARSCALFQFLVSVSVPEVGTIVVVNNFLNIAEVQSGPCVATNCTTWGLSTRSSNE